MPRLDPCASALGGGAAANSLDDDWSAAAARPGALEVELAVARLTAHTPYLLLSTRVCTETAQLWSTLSSLRLLYT